MAGVKVNLSCGCVGRDLIVRPDTSEVRDMTTMVYLDRPSSMHYITANMGTQAIELELMDISSVIYDSWPVIFCSDHVARPFCPYSRQGFELPATRTEASQEWRSGSRTSVFLLKLQVYRLIRVAKPE